jgi:hypothetical protein
MKNRCLADLAFVVTPHPIGAISLKEARKKADQNFSGILDVGTKWKPKGTEIIVLGKPAYPLERIRLKGTFRDVNTTFFEKRGSLCLPIIPSTAEAVGAMLKGTSHKPEEVVWVVPPRMGTLTVELVAPTRSWPVASRNICR